MRWRHGWLVGLLVASSGPARARPASADLSAAVYPLQRIELRFSHRVHLATGALACGDCHRAAESARAADPLVPGHSVCGRCHVVDPPADPPSAAAIAPPPEPDPLTAFYGAPPVEPTRKKPANDCTLCHPRVGRGLPALPLALPAANLHFPHDRHLRAGVGCQRCHPGVDEATLATRANLPSMTTCLHCHRGGPGHPSDACETCHPVRRGGGLETRFPSGMLVPARALPAIAHGEGFRSAHAEAARSSGALCETCHTRTECLECHAGVLKPFGIHPADWLALHPVAARHDAPSCQGCHRAQTFCVTCHERLGIGRDAPDDLRPAGSGRFHPEGFASFDVGPEHHSRVARRDLSTCVACHREETCLSCHAEVERGGLGVNPHPDSVLARCRTLLATTPRACAKCHASAPPCP